VHQFSLWYGWKHLTDGRYAMGHTWKRIIIKFSPLENIPLFFFFHDIKLEIGHSSFLSRLLPLCSPRARRLKKTQVSQECGCLSLDLIKIRRGPKNPLKCPVPYCTNALRSHNSYQFCRRRCMQFDPQ